MSAAQAARRMCAADLVRSVEAGQRKPFYVLFGEEDFERERAAAWLVDELAPQVAGDFNIDRFAADDVAPSAILDAYEQYPLMATHRLVVVNRCEQLTSDACRQLERMVDKPMETSIVVATGGKVDMRRRLFQRMGTAGMLVEFKTPSEKQLPRWIRRYARRAGATVDSEAAALLAMLVGRNLRWLAAEIDKAATFVGAGGQITREVVERVAGLQGHSSVFSLGDALGNGDLRRGLSLLRRLIADGEEAAHITAMLGRHFQLLLRARALLDERRRPADSELAAVLKVPPYFAAGYAKQARRRSRRQLWASMGAIAAADSRAKSLGARQIPLVLDLLALELCPPDSEPTAS